MCAQRAISSTFSRSLGACAPRRQSLIDETETCTASPSSLIFAGACGAMPQQRIEHGGGEW